MLLKWFSLQKVTVVLIAILACFAFLHFQTVGTTSPVARSTATASFVIPFVAAEAPDVPKTTSGLPTAPLSGGRWSAEELRNGRAVGRRLMPRDPQSLLSPLTSSVRSGENTEDAAVAPLFGRWAPAQCTAWSAVGATPHLLDSCNDKRLVVPPWVTGNSTTFPTNAPAARSASALSSVGTLPSQHSTSPPLFKPPSTTAASQIRARSTSKHSDSANSDGQINRGSRWFNDFRDRAAAFGRDVVGRVHAALKGTTSTESRPAERTHASSRLSESSTSTQQARRLFSAAAAGNVAQQELLTAISNGFAPPNLTTSPLLADVGYGRMPQGKQRRTHDQCRRFRNSDAWRIKGGVGIGAQTQENVTSAEWKVPQHGFCTSWRTGIFDPPVTHDVLIKALSTLPSQLRCAPDTIFGSAPFAFTEHNAPRSAEPNENLFGSLEADFAKVCGWDYLSPLQLLAVLHRAAEGGTRPIVISGDSMMRNVFGRVVAAIRGQSFALEHSGWIDIRYVVRSKSDEVFVRSPTAKLATKQNIPPLYKEPECNVDDLDDPCLLLLQFLWEPYDDMITTAFLARVGVPTRRYVNSVLWTGPGRAEISPGSLSNNAKEARTSTKATAAAAATAESFGLSPRFRPTDVGAVPIPLNRSRVAAWVPPDGCLRVIPVPQSHRLDRPVFVRAEHFPSVHLHGSMYWFKDPAPKPSPKRGGRRMSVDEDQNEANENGDENNDKDVRDDDDQVSTDASDTTGTDFDTVQDAPKDVATPSSPSSPVKSGQRRMRSMSSTSPKKTHDTIFLASRRYRRFVAALTAGTQRPVFVPPSRDVVGNQQIVDFITATAAKRRSENVNANRKSTGSKSSSKPTLVNSLNRWLDTVPEGYGQCPSLESSVDAIVPVPYRFIHLLTPPRDGGPPTWVTGNSLIEKRNYGFRSGFSSSNVFSVPAVRTPGTDAGSALPTGQARDIQTNDISAVNETAAPRALSSSPVVPSSSTNAPERRLRLNPNGGTRHIIAFDSLMQSISPLRRIRAKKDHIHYQCHIQRPVPRRPAWIAGDWNGCYDDVNLAVVQWYALALHAFALRPVDPVVWETTPNETPPAPPTNTSTPD